jgi:hypothetical protein
MKQTAVEWLKNEMAKKIIISDKFEKSTLDLFIEALELEKQQMLHFWHGGLFANESGGKNFETYYNETYKPSA